MNSPARLAVFAITVLALSCIACPALAALGANAASIDGDRVQLKAKLSSFAQPSYSVHLLELPGGSVVREYADGAGLVFAVTWSGPFKPDLRQTLGDYFARYLSAERKAGSGRAQLSIVQPDLVIESGGRLRSFSGRAYLPGAIPTEVALADLR
ncbi:MAG TPA: DUF2844 domain-containing protein [Steroidobacteraceae bacterium]|nr:DUF2844 domain-containing protein [Steroidobacteraceae bacterium]